MSRAVKERVAGLEGWKEEEEKKKKTKKREAITEGRRKGGEEGRAVVFTKEDLMDGRVWVGGWAAADADAERQLQAQGDGRPKASQGSQGSQDLHAHRLGWAGALGATGVPRGLRGSLFTSIGLVQYLLV